MIGQADRRTVMFGLATALLGATAGGCGRARAPGPAGPRLDPAVWRSYRARFFHAEGRIVDSGNGGISHSEGQGYGLLFAAAAGDRATFDALLGWTERTLARRDMSLFSWRYVPGAADPVSDPNNATDGDLLIAWALLCAGRTWGAAAYLARAAEIRGAIARHLIVKQANISILLPGLNGFSHGGSLTLNPSYYLWPIIGSFAEIDSATWSPLLADGLRLLDRMRFGAQSLPADWVEMLPDGTLRPAPDHPPRFGYDAIRIPIYLLLSGRRKGAETIRRFWSAPHRPPPAWIDLITGESAPYALSPGGRAVAARLLGQPVRVDDTDRDYYSATLAVLARMVP